MKNRNDSLTSLWERNAHKVDVTTSERTVPLLWPSCYHKPPTNIDILFVGLNPSDSFPSVTKSIPRNSNNRLFRSIKKNGFLKGIQYDGQGYTSEEIAELDGLAMSNHSYFGKFKELGDFILSDDMTEDDAKGYYHVDLYKFRLQNSNLLMELIAKNEDFFSAQLQETIGFIREARPRMMLVANKNASAAMLQTFPLMWDDQKGCHVHKEDGWTCDVFLSGMITQTRAIDAYSYERLRWHMKAVYDGQKMKRKSKKGLFRWLGI